MEEANAVFHEGLDMFYETQPVTSRAKYTHVLFAKMYDTFLKPSILQAKLNNLNTKETIELLAPKIGEWIRNNSVRERLNLCNDVKDNTKAAQLRSQGKKMFHPNVKRYIEAIKLYNESIAFSEKGSTERALAYANRSNICLKMQRFEECRKNIRLARESNYPGEKLIQHEKEVKNALAKARNKNASSSKVSPDVVEEPELSYPVKENAPQVANCLELRKNVEYGRHVVATRKLKVGDVVMIERPLVTVLKDSFRYVRCDFCHGERPFTLIPCEGCTMAMYCSEECLSKAYNKYHRYECGLLRDLWEVFEEVPLIAIRMIAIAIATFDNNPETLKDHLDALDESNVNGFTMDWNKATQQDIFNTVHVLTTNQERRDSIFVAFHIFNATILHTLILERTELGPVCGANPAFNKFLLDLILRYMQIVNCNRKLLSFNAYKVKEYEDESFAVGCYPLISMLNHSCAPNVQRITLRDGRCAVFVIRPVLEGSQLFDSYETGHTLHEREMRQSMLSFMYSFQCTCEACTFNYPTWKVLVEGMDVTNSEDMAKHLYYNRMLSSHEDKKVRKIMAELRSFLNETPKLYPESEVCFTQVEFVRSLQVLYNQTSENAEYWKHCKP
uniref:SET and MYND domain-containing protein 4-like n=1 Tax=Anopheles coluzzii TaxID=1518534 RepID=UPI0020FF8490|nr:SET and MYND domain-containing protein 4-like [Anopheles coluzzii]